jgi:hypothetical protein
VSFENGFAIADFATIDIHSKAWIDGESIRNSPGVLCKQRYSFAGSMSIIASSPISERKEIIFSCAGIFFRPFIVRKECVARISIPVMNSRVFEFHSKLEFVRSGNEIVCVLR